jgi:aminopeptidase N
VLTPAARFNSLGIYASAVYTKGSGILWMLRGMLGRAKFDRALRAYFEKLKFKNATTSDFAIIVEETSDQELDWFFDQWLKTTKTLDFAVKSVSSVTQPNGRVTLQATVSRAGEAVMPVHVQFVLSDGSKIEEIWDGQSSEKQITFETQVSLVQVIIDPDQILLESNRANNVGIVQGRNLESRAISPLASFAEVIPE